MAPLTLPSSLAEAIAEESARLPLASLIEAAQSLSRSYRRENGALPAILNDAGRAAYLATRFPATYAAITVALSELARTVDTQSLRTLIDVGAGPGTATLAALALIPSISLVRQVERDRGWLAIAARLSTSVTADVTNERRDLRSMDTTAHDLVVAAYALNELPESERDATVLRLWAASQQALVVVEPGTPDGFAIVRRVRELCLEQGGHAAAPCTHNAFCPMTRDDWCHRTARVTRSALHRRLKDAQLAYEDEKFSYVAMTRQAPRRLSPGRIVRRPIRAGGHVHLDLCTAAGLERSTVTRSDRQNYKAARDADWGDLWPTPTGDASE